MSLSLIRHERKLLSWKPSRQPGGIYCSPACGLHCRMAEYKIARTQSRALVTKLGRGWRPVIWENCGWHWRVVKGAFEIAPSGSGYFSAYLQSQFFAYAKTAEAALAKVVRVARRSCDQIQKQIASL